MPVRFNYTFLRFRRLLLLSFLLLVFFCRFICTANQNLNPQSRKTSCRRGPGLYWLCGIAETGRHSSGTAGLRQYSGRVPDVCGTRWRKTEPGWKRKKSSALWHFCANFVPLAYKNRPYLGICGNSEEQSSYWYYYPYLLQSVTVYPLWKTSNLNVGSSSLSARTSNINRLHIIHLQSQQLLRSLYAI